MKNESDTMTSMHRAVVKRGVAMEHATEALIQLIKVHGRWVDPLSDM